MIKYIREKGVKRAAEVIYRYKLPKLYAKIMLAFLKNRKLKNIIMIESHNDFDCNGGAFYDYLIEHGYNKKYKIVWLLKHDRPKTLPENVVCLPLYKPSLRKAYYTCMAKILTADCVVTGKLRSDQTSYYFNHGSVAIKKLDKNANYPDSIDYALSSSEYSDKLWAKQMRWEYPNKKFIHVGIPVLDRLFDEKNDEIKKVVGTSASFDKVVMWMPTFRKGGGYGRNDGAEDTMLGIPLIESCDMYGKLNLFLKEKNMLLIIKIHPMQDMDTVKIADMSNIRVLTGESVKKRNIDTYRLLKNTDALMSDYSSIAYEYMLLDRPLGFVFSDVSDYKPGLFFEDVDSFMPGDKIYVFDDLKNFLAGVAEGRDDFCVRRREVRDLFFMYRDGNSTARLVEFMGL